MGLFGDIGRFIGGAAKVVGSVLPGPIGAVAKIGGGILAPSVRPAPSQPLVTPGARGYPTAVDRLTGRSDATTVKGIISNSVRYSPFAGAANVVSDFGGPSIGQRYAAAPGFTGGQITAPGFTNDLMSVTTVTEARAPKGYRVHTVTPSTAPLLNMEPGSKVAVRLGSTAARILGVKRSKKPVLSVRDSEALRRAARAKAKVAKISKGAGLHVYTTPRAARAHKH